MKSKSEILEGLLHHSGQSGEIVPCDGCPYDDDEGGCSQRLTADALSLLKVDEEDPMYPVEVTEAFEGAKATEYFHYWKCGSCGSILEHFGYCDKCGRKVKWEGNLDVQQ